MEWWPIAVLLSLAFAINVPLGAWRGRQRKLSPAWFAGIHASIPVLILLRTQLDITPWVMPAEAVLLLAGQTAGNRWGGSLLRSGVRMTGARVKADT